MEQKKIKNSALAARAIPRDHFDRLVAAHAPGNAPTVAAETPAAPPNVQKVGQRLKNLAPAKKPGQKTPQFWNSPAFIIAAMLVIALALAFPKLFKGDFLFHVSFYLILFTWLPRLTQATPLEGLGLLIISNGALYALRYSMNAPWDRATGWDSGALIAHGILSLIVLLCLGWSYANPQQERAKPWVRWLMLAGFLFAVAAICVEMATDKPKKPVKREVRQERPRGATYNP